MDLKTKLAFALVSACLLSMGALGTFTYLWAEGMFLEDSQRRLVARAASRKTEIRGVFDGWKRNVRALATHSRLPQLTRHHLDSATVETLDRITQVLEDARASSDAIRRLALFDVEGSRLYGDHAVGSESAPAVPDLPDADVAYSGARTEESGSLGVVFHAAVTLNGRRVGILEVVFDAGALNAIVGPTADVGNTGQTLVLVPISGAPVTAALDERYVVLAPPEPDADSERAYRLPSEVPTVTAVALAGGEEALAAVLDARGNEVMAATRFLAESGIGVVVQVDNAEVQARADRLLDDMRDLGAAVAAFAILGGTLLGFRLARPINRLVEEVDRIRHGEIGLRLNVKGEDEVAFLAMSLNEFMDQLDRSSDLFQLGELNILLVDGDSQGCRILQDLLQNWNMRPTVADREASALRSIEQAEREGDPFQLILVDESTTDTDSAGLVESLRSSNWHACPVIVLSSTADARVDGASEKTDIGRVLPKPVIASHLMEAILDEMGVSAQGLASTTDVYLKKTVPKKILLAEDSALIQRVMLGFLKNWGHEVTSVENGRLAVERAQAERFDLVLMDVEMPEMNGLDATAAIRASEREGDRIPIIALTAEARTGDRERCLAAGMDDYLPKPADPKALYALINRCPARRL
jgi:CheY-like chemotaxis protein